MLDLQLMEVLMSSGMRSGLVQNRSEPSHIRLMRLELALLRGVCGEGGSSCW